MKSQVFPLTKYNPNFNKYLPFPFNHEYIYQSSGLRKHVEKRHPECLPYLDFLDSIITSPDYIGVNPNESVPSFELVKIFDKNIQIGIKLDMKHNYLYVATLYIITVGTLSLQEHTRSIKSKFCDLLCYFQSAYHSVRFIQVPCRAQNLSLFDSATSTMKIFVICKADD